MLPILLFLIKILPINVNKNIKQTIIWNIPDHNMWKYGNTLDIFWVSTDIKFTISPTEDLNLNIKIKKLKPCFITQF